MKRLEMTTREISFIALWLIKNITVQYTALFGVEHEFIPADRVEGEPHFHTWRQERVKLLQRLDNLFTSHTNGAEKLILIATEQELRGIDEICMGALQSLSTGSEKAFKVGKGEIVKRNSTKADTVRGLHMKIENILFEEKKKDA